MAINQRSGLGESFSDINVTPLVDVMLVLLVIFIITAPLIVPQSIKVNLPQTTSLSKDSNDNRASLVIQADHSLIYDGVVISDANLEKQLMGKASDKTYQLQIQADKTVQFGRIAEIMAVAQSAGITKLNFLTLPAK